MSKWRTKVEESRSDKPPTKDRSDQPPKLVRVKKTQSTNSSESVAKKWLNKSKVGKAAHPGTHPGGHPGAHTGADTAARRQLPSTTASKWTTAKSKTLALNRLNNGALIPQNKSGVNTSSSAQSILGNKASSLQSSLVNKPPSTAPKSVPNTRANWRTAAVKSKAIGSLTKPVGPSGTVGAKKPFVPYKTPSKSGVGVKPGLSTKRGPTKLGGTKMGGKFF